MTFATLETHRTGDINFFSACMAIGISPAFPEPAQVMQNDDGRDYLSFSLSPKSECGLYETRDMSHAWSFPRQFKAENPAHPFSLVMEFSSASRGAKTKDDWIEKAAEFLSVSRDSIRKSIKDIVSLETRAPESPLTYIVCFIVNRFAAIQWAKSAIPKVVVNKGSSVVMLDGNLPIKKQNFILSHL